MTQGFLEHVTADHYVISADGEDDNPDHDIFRVVRQRPRRGFLHNSYHQQEARESEEEWAEADIAAQVTKAIDDSAAVAVNRKIVVTGRAMALSCKVDLGTSAVNY